MKKEKTTLIGWILLLILSLVCIGGFVAYHIVLKDMVPANLKQIVELGVNYGGVVIITSVVTAFAICLTFHIHYKRLNARLRSENIFNFAKPNHFFNYDLFSKRAKSMHKKLKKDEPSFVVTFTTSHYSMMKNSSRNPEVSELNGYIADFLTEYFVKDKIVPSSKAAFCFFRGQFLMYIAASEEKVREIIDTVETKIYALVSDNSIKLFVQPFFGLAKAEEGETLPMVVDNAFLARDLSEKNFETITLYKSNYRKAASKSELQEIKDAIENNELVIYYQPKFNLNSKTFISAEALVRWNSPKYGLVSPAKFIEKAELGGLIHELDMYVFRKVCEDLGEMKQEKKRMIPVSVNFSIYEFYSPSFLDDVDKIIKSSNINPSMVEIEITETTSQANPFLSVSILKKLKEYGLKILMDDFGLGYSNLATLNKVPFDTIKIDKSFIDGIVSDLKAREIVKFLISLCKTNGMEVIAEGVDKPEQVEILKKIRCDTIQGYFYSEPLSKADFEQFLKENPFEKREEA